MSVPCTHAVRAFLRKCVAVIRAQGQSPLKKPNQCFSDEYHMEISSINEDSFAFDVSVSLNLVQCGPFCHGSIRAGRFSQKIIFDRFSIFIFIYFFTIFN